MAQVMSVRSRAGLRLRRRNVQSGRGIQLSTFEATHRAADNASQIRGVVGYCNPTVAERLYCDQRIHQIHEWSSEVQRPVLSRAIRKEPEEHMK